MFKFNLGQEVKEIVTGLSGVIMGRTEYFTGCIQYGISSRELDKDGNLKEWVWLDESRLIGTEYNINIEKASEGPQSQVAPTIN